MTEFFENEKKNIQDYFALDYDPEYKLDMLFEVHNFQIRIIVFERRVRLLIDDIEYVNIHIMTYIVIMSITWLLLFITIEILKYKYFSDQQNSSNNTGRSNNNNNRNN